MDSVASLIEHIYYANPLVYTLLVLLIKPYSQAYFKDEEISSERVMNLSSITQLISMWI